MKNKSKLTYDSFQESFGPCSSLTLSAITLGTMDPEVVSIAVGHYLGAHFQQLFANGEKRVTTAERFGISPQTIDYLSKRTQHRVKVHTLLACANALTEGSVDKLIAAAMEQYQSEIGERVRSVMMEALNRALAAERPDFEQAAAAVKELSKAPIDVVPTVEQATEIIDLYVAGSEDEALSLLAEIKKPNIGKSGKELRKKRSK